MKLYDAGLIIMVIIIGAWLLTTAPEKPAETETPTVTVTN